MMLAAPELVIAETVELLDEVEIAAELQKRVLANGMMRGEKGAKFQTRHDRSPMGARLALNTDKATLGLFYQRNPAGGTTDARHERHSRDPEAGGSADPFLFSDHPDHRGGGGGRDQTRDLPSGAGRGPYGRRLLAGLEREAARRLCDAIRAGRRECVRGSRNGLFGFEPGRLSAARPSTRDR